jgi:hypothetical protein
VILSDYICPACDAVFEATVESPSPDEIPCPVCAGPAAWFPTPVHGHVRRVEAVRGKWEKPERKTYLDTRNLGEGQDPAEFQAERRKMWRDVRMGEARKEFLNK